MARPTKWLFQEDFWIQTGSSDSMAIPWIFQPHRQSFLFVTSFYYLLILLTLFTLLLYFLYHSQKSKVLLCSRSTPSLSELRNSPLYPSDWEFSGLTYLHNKSAFPKGKPRFPRGSQVSIFPKLSQVWVEIPAFEEDCAS